MWKRKRALKILSPRVETMVRALYPLPPIGTIGTCTSLGEDWQGCNEKFVVTNQKNLIIVKVSTSDSDTFYDNSRVEIVWLIKCPHKWCKGHIELSKEFKTTKIRKLFKEKFPKGLNF